MRGAYLGRFNPFGLHHEGVIKHIRSWGIDDLVIGIGSAQYNHVHKHPSKPWVADPFTYLERERMIRLVLGDSVEIQPVEDVHDIQYWASRVVSQLKPDVYFTNNQREAEEIARLGVRIERFPTIPGVSATRIRKMIIDCEPLDGVLDSKVIAYLDEIGARERLISLEMLDKRGGMLMKKKHPRMATDCIVEVYDRGEFRGIALIERKHSPYGWAIPGGMLDYGLTLKENAVKEMSEELKVDVEITDYLGYYDDPKRDPRWHIVTHTFIGRTEQEIGWGDDAKNSRVFKVEDYPNEFAFVDHPRILKDYERWRNERPHSD